MMAVEIAEVAHEVNRAYCQALGDNTLPPWSAAPAWQKQSVVDGVLFHIDNPGAGPEASHQNWFNHKFKEGWKYGPEKDASRKQHPCMVPFDSLPAHQRAKDYIFRAVVHALAR